MSRNTCLAIIALLALVPAVSCDSGAPSPGPIIVIGPPDGDATSNWEKGGTTMQRDASWTSGGKVREDFVGVSVEQLKCGGTEADEIKLTLDDPSNPVLKIKRTSLGLQWCWDHGATESCLIAEEVPSGREDKIPSDFLDWKTAEADGSPCTSDVTFQVGL